MVLLSDYRGIISGVRKSENYSVVFCRYIEEGIAAFICEVFSTYSSFRALSKPLLALLAELAFGVESRISKEGKPLSSRDRVSAVSAPLRLPDYLPVNLAGDQPR